MSRVLHIHEPCAEPWDGMTGTDALKHCARCDKQVVALAEMTAEEASARLRSAKPGSLCVRVEHDADGGVYFRDKGPSASLLRLAVGASLFVAACSKTEPSPLPAPEKADVTEARANAQDEAAPHAPASAEAGTNGKRAVAEGKDGDGHATGKPSDKAGRHVTTGCACQLNDPLCSCL